MYLMGAYVVLRMTNQDALSEDLESDPFLNSALQRFTCELYYRFVGLITSRHYLSEQGSKNGDDRSDEQTADNTLHHASTLSKLTGQLQEENKVALPITFTHPRHFVTQVLPVNQPKEAPSLG